MHDVHGIADLPDSAAPGRRAGRANEVLPAYFADYERDARHRRSSGRSGSTGSTTRTGCCVVRAGDRGLADPDARQRDRHLAAAVRPALPRHRDVRAASSCTPSTTRARSTSAAGGSSSSAAEPPRSSSSASSRRSPNRLGDPAASRCGARTTSRPRSGARRSALVEERVRRGLPPAQRRQRHRSRAARAGARGRAARRLRAAADVRRDRARRACAAPTATVRAGRRDPLGDGLPAGGRAPGAAAPARPRGGIQLDGTTAVADPRVQLVGYGPSASTIGANRAGRVAARGVAGWLDSTTTATAGCGLTSRSSSSRPGRPSGSTTSPVRT